MAAVTNLVTNPSFETGTTGWTATNGTLTQDSTVTPGSGSSSAKLVSTGATVMSLTYTATGLTIGKQYVFSFYTKIQSVATDFSVVPSITGIVTPTLPILRSGDDFQRRHVGFIATATSHDLVVTTSAAVAIGDILWADRVMLHEGNHKLPYFDGAYPFSAWTGTANASTSTNTAFDSTYSIPTDEALVVGGLCMNTQAWMITSRTGRHTVPGFRGDDITVPGVSGKTFVANKPLDTGLYTLTMIILGIHPDGTVPHPTAQRDVFQDNYETILRACLSSSAPVTLYSWQPDGTVRTTTATLIGNSPDPTLNVGGRRAEVSFVFTILPGMWKDFNSTTVTGTASASWSNQALALTKLANGTAPIEDSVITVTGPITNPVVSNVVTGTSVTYTGTVPAGQTWVIDCGAWTSKVNGASVLSATTHSGHARFVVIGPGPTDTGPTINLSGSGTTTATNLSIVANRKHLVGS